MRNHVFWTGLEASIAAILSLSGSFIIARIIGPSELGVGAAAVAVHVVLWVAVNGLFADAIVQVPSVTDRSLSSAFWASIAVGCFAVVPQVGAGFVLAGTLVDARLIPMSAVLALSLPLVGAGGAIQGLLTRERAYKQLALRTLLGQGAGTVCGLMSAQAGSGGWALVLQQATTSYVGALILLVVSRWSPTRCIDGGAIRGLLKIGLPLAASTFVLIARYRIFSLLVGGAAGPAALGQVHVAFRLVDTVKELTFTALWRLMLPRMAAAQGDLGLTMIQVDWWTRWCVMCLFPPCAAMGLILPSAVSWFLGSGWAASGQAALPLVGLMAWSIVTFPAGVALIATGGVKLALIANLLGLLVSSLAASLFPPADAWHAIMLWVISQLVVSPFSLWINARALGVGVMRPLFGGFRLSFFAR